MTKTQFDAAVKLAQQGNLGEVDDTVLYGCALPGFMPVTVTLEAVAKFIAWHCIMLNGQVDSEALNEMRTISRKRWLVC